ncbi:DJ-1 family glyoxalase III [Oscillospiraceae bacterium PP1C4]
MIYVFLGEGFEEVEALAAVDVLRRAELEVQLVGVGARQVTGAHGITVLCDISESDATPEHLDMIVLPGGMPGTLMLERSEIVQSFIDFAADNDKWIAAICAAPSILGHKGLLQGRTATCYTGFEEQLMGAKLSQEAVCVDGRFVTARGMGVAVDFALKLVELLISPKRAEILKAALLCKG